MQGCVMPMTDQQCLEGLGLRLAESGFQTTVRLILSDDAGPELVETGAESRMRGPIVVDRGAFVWADEAEHIAWCADEVLAVSVIRQEWAERLARTERTWCLQAERASVCDARANLEGALRGWGYPCATIDDAQTIVSELASNAVRYGQGDDYRVKVTRQADYGLLIEVFDHSPRQPVVKSPDDCGDESGRGLIMVGALSADWGTASSDSAHGKSVWAVLAPAH